MNDCIWLEDSDGNYETSCANFFIIIDGTPEENNMKFCCYCGKGLDAVRYATPDDYEEDDGDDHRLDDPQRGQAEYNNAHRHNGGY